jgi:hypothetical protein
MTDIELKAMELANSAGTYKKALFRAVEQHEAFKQKVSDAITVLLDRFLGDGLSQGVINGHLHSFVIPKPKPKRDPLVDALTEAFSDGGVWEPCNKTDAANLRAALEARGFEIREKGQ